MILAKHRALEAAAIFCCGLILFTIGLGQQEVIGFESRFYLFALEASRHGLSWFPTTYGAPYPDYPGLPTGLIVWAASVMGKLNKFTAVLPSAIASAITLATVYLIGALRDRRWGLFAVCFLLLTNMFVMEARTISPDQYIVMVTTVCFYLAYSSGVLQKTRRLGFIPLLFFVGFACRGPIGLVVPAGVLCVFYLMDKQLKSFLIVSLVAVVVLALSCVALFGLAYHEGGMLFVRSVLQMEVSGRLQDATLPWYFYFVESIGAYAVTYPLAILLVMGLVKDVFAQHAAPDMKLIQKLVGWALVVLLGLTIPAGKKIRYILAFAPAIALISAYLFVLPARKSYLFYLQKVAYWFCCFLPLIGLLVVLRIQYLVPQTQLSVDIAYLPLISVLLAFLTTSLIVSWRQLDSLIVVAIAALTFVLCYILVVEPINIALNRTRDFVVSVEALRHQQQAKLVFYQENPDAMPIKYVVNMPQEENPIFADSVDALLQINPPAIFIAREESFAELSNAVPLLRKVAVGNIGREPMVVFERAP